MVEVQLKEAVRWAARMTELYRAVSISELQDIRERGKFCDPPHKSGEKGFFYSRDSAEHLAQWFTQSGFEEHVVVSALVPDAVVHRGRVHDTAQEGPGVYLRVEDLDLLTEITGVHS